MPFSDSPASATSESAEAVSTTVLTTVPTAVPTTPPVGHVSISHLLADGELTVTGRLTDASNITLLCTARSPDGGPAGSEADCVYKPIRGERPLWDFPDGTLADRETASYLISEAAGWHCVPVTVLRSGPFGPGMVQQWIGDADSDLTADLVPADALPAGWIPVLRAVDTDGEPVVLAHADTIALQVLAGFDLVVNNADRKASHILPTPDGRVRGVDHGVTLHAEPKLRTILWGWAGRPLPEPVTNGLRLLSTALTADLGEQLSGMVTGTELAALHARIDALIADPVFPLPPTDRTPIPWPPL